jgi:flavodoxin
MKSVILSYSLTGNNKALANSIAKELELEHIHVTESKSRNMGTIVMDIIFNRTPKVQPTPDILEKYDQIFFLGPVWMGQLATPFRSYFNYLKTNQRKHAYISISGGADGPNPKLNDELKKRIGKEPVTLIDLHIADLLPSEPKPTRNVTMAYRINDQEVKTLSNTIVKNLQEIMRK